MDRAPKTKKLVIPAALAVAMIGAAVASASSCSSKQESSCDTPGLGEGGNASDAGCPNTGGGGGSGGAVA